MVKQFRLTLSRMVTKPTPLGLWLGSVVLSILLAAGAGAGAAVYVTTTLSSVHLTASGVVIDPTGAAANTPQQITLGNFASGALSMGQLAQNNLFLGCTGTAVAACNLSFFTNGTGSSSTGSLDNVGNLLTNGAGTHGGGSANVKVGGACASSSLLQLCVNASQSEIIPAGSTQPLTLSNAANTVVNLQAPDAGGLQAHFNGNTTLTYVPMMYTTGGVAAASTLHGVVGVISLTISGTCAANTQCSWTGSNTVTFTGAAQFTSATSYGCGVKATSGNIGYATAGSGTQVVINAYNASGAGETGGIDLPFECIGT